ncbi:uncharacterized protein LOC118193708 [Stegodyphus dumicola]|uniref:uncharacterized protein LOC118193708 n=1 Tax=Stegodyphus dumicola TaxID=202533 RepID=UPI0015ABB965|nr:uncharacterized protein LOC118193708 [Stegodyphus dumicola]
MSEVENYGSLSAASELDLLENLAEREYVLYRKRKLESKLFRNCLLSSVFVLVAICMLVFLGIMIDHVPLIWEIIGFSTGITLVLICSCSIFNYDRRLRELNEDDDSFEEQATSNPEIGVQNPNPSSETEGQLLSFQRSGVKFHAHRLKVPGNWYDENNKRISEQSNALDAETKRYTM